jgi:hypothetical protein
MRATTILSTLALLASFSSKALYAQQMSATLPVSPDSLYSRVLGVLSAGGYLIELSDARTRRVAALTSDRAVRALIEVDPQRDSSHLAVTAQPTQAGGSVSSMAVMISLVHAISRPGKVTKATAPSGKDWPRDASNRVGFLIVGPWLAKDFGVRPGDTIPEIRPSEVPDDFRESIERNINAVGFDASCARFFRTGRGDAERLAVRFNMCAEPKPDLDRLEIFDGARNFVSQGIGESIGEDIRVMCPVSRGARPAASGQCPVPFR